MVTRVLLLAAARGTIMRNAFNGNIIYRSDYDNCNNNNGTDNYLQKKDIQPFDQSNRSTTHCCEIP
jgi:hypothetical protein